MSLPHFDGRLIYLASPYTHRYPAVVHQRYVAAVRAVGHLARHGLRAYSPIGHTHPLTEYVGQQTLEYWLAYDMPLLLRSDELWVLCLSGWTSSAGVAEEIRVAREHGKPIRYLLPAENVNDPVQFLESSSSLTEDWSASGDMPDTSASSRPSLCAGCVASAVD